MHAKNVIFAKSIFASHWFLYKLQGAVSGYYQRRSFEGKRLSSESETHLFLQNVARIVAAEYTFKNIHQLESWQLC